MFVCHTRHRVQRLRPVVEQLELRAVLSVCGVECELTGGVLNVAGTAADDSIALRYDTQAGLVSVMGGDNELIGRYPLSAVNSLNVDGGAGDDRFEVDAHLPLEINVDGGEGEDLLAALAQAGHNHGGGPALVLLEQSSIEGTGPFASSAAATSASSGGDAFGPAFGAAGPSSNSIAPPLSASTSNLALLTAAPASESHTQHVPTIATLLAEPHGSHAAGSVLATGFTSTGAAITAMSVSAYSAQGDWLPAGSSADRWEGSGEHHGRGEASPTGDVVAKLAPKRCTVRFTSKDASRNVMGDRKCDCAQKAAAQAAAERAAQSEQASDSSKPATAAATLVACPRCRLAATSPELAADLALAGEVCDLPLNDEVVLSTARAQCEASPSDEAFGSSSLPFAGLALAAGGLLLAPSIRRRKTRSATNALLGRLGMERLGR